jgi:hypothetical protein
MAIFKDHKVGINDLLGVIPEALLSHLSEDTGYQGFRPDGIILEQPVKKPKGRCLSGKRKNTTGRLLLSE